jgi:hypothetical protein
MLAPQTVSPRFQVPERHWLLGLEQFLARLQFLVLMRH